MKIKTLLQIITEGRPNYGPAKNFFAEVTDLSVPLHPAIVCKDGFRVSVQARCTSYCIPRDNIGPYTHVELGFPSEAPIPEIMYYAEDPSNPTKTVYAYVPVDLVQKLIDAHGGEETFHLQVGPLDLEIYNP